MVHVVGRELGAIAKRYLESNASGQHPRPFRELKQGAIDVLSGYVPANLLR